MAMRFRKSVNLGGGLKLNLGKNSFGISAGVKGARKSVNSKGRITKSVGIPGTGVSSVTARQIGSKETAASGDSGFSRDNAFSSEHSSEETSFTTTVPTKLKTPSTVWDGRLFCLALIFLVALLHHLYSFVEGTPGVVLAIVKIGGCAFGAIAFLLSFAENDRHDATDAGRAMKVTLLVISAIAIAGTIYGISNFMLCDRPVQPLSSSIASLPATAPLGEDPLDAQNGAVYITASGNKYHSNSTCSGMSNPAQVSLEDAIEQGYEPCNKCSPQTK